MSASSSSSSSIALPKLAKLEWLPLFGRGLNKLDEGHSDVEVDVEVFLPASVLVPVMDFDVEWTSQSLSSQLSLLLLLFLLCRSESPLFHIEDTLSRLLPPSN